MSELASIPWADVIAVGIRTTADGPYGEDLCWQFLLPDRCVEVPGGLVGGPEFEALPARLPGLDLVKVVRAMGSTDERIYRVWHREESRAIPAREELAARFVALVGTLGGDPAAAPAIFDRVHAAWSPEPRGYHGLDHLLDCLRELDGAGGQHAAHMALAELALWYHDLVYVPGAADCEERSAQALLADAATLAIPEATALAAAALVRATAHAYSAEPAPEPKPEHQHDQARSAPASAAADLVVDIDLAILGRDPLRFMDYEYSVEEEYAGVSTIRFRCGRGRFLAALLDRPHIFRTAHFRARYEERARAQLAALLASPRYRCWRWLRWIPRWRGRVGGGERPPTPMP